MDLVHEFSHILSVTVNVDQRYSGKHFFEDEEQKFAQFDLDPPLLPGIFDGLLIFFFFFPRIINELTNF